MKKLSKNFAFMLTMLDTLRSKADYYNMVRLETLKADCVNVINNSPKQNYN